MYSGDEFYGEEITSPLVRPQAARNCQVCGCDCRGKKVWEKRGVKVICMSCGQTHTFSLNGTPITRIAAQRARPLPMDGNDYHTFGEK